MRLRDDDGNQIELSFPDLPGEDFARMWERRELDQGLVETLTAPSLVLLVNGDTIKAPAWLVNWNHLYKQFGSSPAETEPVEWSANLAPTQVRVVDLLQMLMSAELNIGPRRLAVLISAWDKVEAEGMAPSEVLDKKLPLLSQYLNNGRDPWTWGVWGISAQGGVYEDPDKDEHFEETERLRDLGRPSDRIKIVDGDAVTSDITQPMKWLIS